MKIRKYLPLRKSYSAIFLWILTVVLLVGFLPTSAKAALLDDVYSRLGNVNSKVTTVNTKVTDLQTKSNEIVDQVRDGVEVLSGNVRGMLDEAIDDMKLQLEAQLEGRDDFVTNEGVAFRQELGDFIGNIETALNQMINITECPEFPAVEISLSQMQSLLDNIPDSALYPIFKIYDPNLSCLLTESLDDLAVVLSGLGTGDSCDIMMENPLVFKTAARALQLRSFQLDLGVKLLDGLSEEFGNTEMDAGIHGYVHITIKTNVPKTFAKILGGISRVYKGTSEFVLNKLEACEAMQEKEEYDAILAGILAEVTGLDDQISSRASQASVDALATTIGNLNVTANTTQITNQISEHQDVALRIAVESQLRKVKNQLAVFYLPESSGGLLEFVRIVVSDTIDASVTLGLYSETMAQEEFQLGEDALAGEDYKRAYDQYRRAYLEIIKWPEGADPVAASIAPQIGTTGYSLNWNPADASIYSVESSNDLVEWKAAGQNVAMSEGNADVLPSGMDISEFYRIVREDEESDDDE